MEHELPPRDIRGEPGPGAVRGTGTGSTSIGADDVTVGAPSPQGPGPGLARRKGPRRVGVGILVACILAGGIGGGVVAGWALPWNGGTRTSATVESTPDAQVIVNNLDSVNAVTAAAQKASPSVVTISASSGSSAGTGSGIILDADGHVLTNTHVVTLDGQAANATIEIRTSDGAVYPGTVVGTDPLSDLAIVKIAAPGLVAATLGDSGKVNVGDTVIAIGAPLGLSGTVTDGIVSSANRTIDIASSAASGSRSRSASTGQASVSINVIQTDAAINPGNSGGALVNSQGEIVGVNVAIASAGSSSSAVQSGNIGVGFSIPINDAKRVAQEIVATGTATHGQLGLSAKDKASGTASGFTAGAEVAAVTPGAAAATAGLKVGDVITDLGARSVTDASELTAAAREQAAGATVKVTFQRAGKEQSLDVTLG